MGKCLTYQSQLTLLPEDFPARTSVLREQGPACPVSAAASGPNFSEYALKLDRVGLLLRTCLGLELSALTGCSLTWQEQVTPLGRWWWVLSMPERPTGGSGFGLLPTPNVPNGGRSVAHVADWRGRTAYHNGKKVQVGLESIAKMGMLPTPKASDGRPKGNGGDRNSPGLDQMAKAGMLPTPTVQDAANNGGPSQHERNSLPLNAVVQMLPTPTAIDAQGRGYQYSGGDHSKPVLTLPGAVGAAKSPQNGTGTGRLSPCFVEWMMGYPVGHTDVSD